MRIFIILLLIFVTGCSNRKVKTDYHTLDCGPFIIETPETWSLKIGYGTFSAEVGNIITGDGDTLSFDISTFANPLTETDSVIIAHNRKLIGKANSDGININDAWGEDLDKYRKNNVSWDTISGKEAKIIFPRKPGYGTTGVYFKRIGDGYLGLSLHGENIHPQNEKLLLQAVRTIRFIRRK